MGRGLHAEDSCVAEALGAWWCGLLGASGFDEGICFCFCAACFVVLDTEGLALFQAGAGGAAGGRGWEVRVIDGVDAAMQEVQGPALVVLAYPVEVVVARHEFPVDTPGRLEAGGATRGELVVEECARLRA